jgi:hypothetical protein
MPQSFGVYGEQKKGVQPWAQTITLFPGAQNVSNFFSLYDSLGDATLVGANTVPTLLDGPEKVVRYGNLVVGDGTTATSLTASNRCKGLTILCDSLIVKANATVNMTGRGARVDRNDDPFFPFMDFKIPFQISLSSDMVSLARALELIKSKGFAPWDLGTWQHSVSSLFGFNLAISQAGSITLLSSPGCGASVLGVYASATSLSGNTGGAGTNGGMGGGGSGGAYETGNVSSFKSGAGCPYSGGSGSGAAAGPGWNCYGLPGSPFSGPGGNAGVTYCTSPLHAKWPGESNAGGYGWGGGGAGNLGGKMGPNSYSGQTDGTSGTGGKLVIIAKTNITVQASGKIEANGCVGGNGGPSPGSGYPSGGGSGGGHVSIISPSITNSGTIQAAGGAGGPNGAGIGGSGGAGSVVTKTFIDMGW